MQRCDACMQMGNGFSFPKGSNQGEFHVWTGCEYFFVVMSVPPIHTLIFRILTLCLYGVTTWDGWRCQVFHPSANLLHHTNKHATSRGCGSGGSVASIRHTTT